MEGVDLTKVLNKGKQMASVAASAANGNGTGKKRRKGDLKPIVTSDATPGATESYVLFFFRLSQLRSYQLPL
jgi:serine/threonine-protein kinase SRPK3